MKRTLAHGLRRAARVLMRWSTKLDPPVLVNIEYNGGSPEELGRRLADRAIQYGNEVSRAFTSDFLNR